MIALALLLPTALVTVIAAAGLLPSRSRHTVRRGAAIASPLAVLPAVVLSVWGEGAVLEIPWLLFGARFEMDAIGRSLTLIAALLYGAALMFVSWLRLRDTEKGSGALSAFLLACYTGNIGVNLAADAASFYLSFTVLSFSAVGLVVHYRTPEARRATLVYLVMSVLSETAVLAGMILVIDAGGLDLADAPAAVANSDNAGLIIALLLIGFGVKAGTFPLHLWLPLAHPAAPTAASAVLSGAMVKAGMIGWLRFLPLGATGATEQATSAITVAGWVLLALSLGGGLLVVLFGVVQRDPKVILAYSTISQMGLIGAVVALGMLQPEMAGPAAAAAVVYAVHHGLAKGALFLGVSVVKHHGHGLKGALVAVGLVGAGLSLAGAPFTTGAFAKYVSKQPAYPVDLFGVVGLDLPVSLVATGSVLLLLRFGWVLWRSEREPRRGVDAELVAWLLVFAASITVPWWVGGGWTPLEIPTWDTEVIWDAVWPILLGLGLGGAVWWLAHRSQLPSWLPAADGKDVPAGDLVVPVEALVRHTGRSGVAALARVHGATGTLSEAWARSWARLGDGTRSYVDGLESRLTAWQYSGTMVLVLLGAGAVLVGWMLFGGGSPQ